MIVLNKELQSLDKTIQKKLKYLRDRLMVDDDPRHFGKPLAYDKYGLWRYRVQNIRVICRIEDKCLLITVLRAAHRKEVY